MRFFIYLAYIPPFPSAHTFRLTFPSLPRGWGESTKDPVFGSYTKNIIGYKVNDDDGDDKGDDWLEGFIDTT